MIHIAMYDALVLTWMLVTIKASLSWVYTEQALGQLSRLVEYACLHPVRGVNQWC